MGLSDFIRVNEEAIIAGWQEFAQIYLPSAKDMDRAALRDHISGVLRFIADDLETPETERERSEKAKGQGKKGGEKQDGAAGSHGDLRFESGFDTIEMIAEFRALRASVVKLWRAEWTQVDDVLPDLLRFNEAMDQVLAESLMRFVENAKSSGNKIIGILREGVCDKLLEIQISLEKLHNNAKLDVEVKKIIAGIGIASSQINGVVSSVIDTIKSPAGAEQPSASPPSGAS